MASYITQYGADELLDWAFNSSGMYLALATGYVSGSPSGTFAEISSGIGYNRIFVSGWTVLSGYAYPNSSGVTFGPAETSGWIVAALGVFDASGIGDGNLWWAGSTSPTGSVGIGQNASFGSGQIQIGFQASGC